MRNKSARHGLKPSTRTAKLIVIAGLFATLSSCSDSFLIEVSRDHTSLVFKKPVVVWTEQFSPCLRWLTIYDVSGQERLIFRMDAPESGCREIERLAIGSAPPGYAVTGSMPKRGDRIRVGASDNEGHLGASEEFQYGIPSS